MNNQKKFCQECGEEANVLVEYKNKQICQYCRQKKYQEKQEENKELPGMTSSNPGIQSGEIHHKRCGGCWEQVQSSFENFSDHDCHKTHLEKHLVANFPKDDSRAKMPTLIDDGCCLFCQEQFRKTIKEKTKCHYCKEFLYEKSKKAGCQMRHELFQKHFPNYKPEEREREWTSNQMC